MICFICHIYKFVFVLLFNLTSHYLFFYFFKRKKNQKVRNGQVQWKYGRLHV